MWSHYVAKEDFLYMKLCELITIVGFIKRMYKSLGSEMLVGTNVVNSHYLIV